MDEIGKWIMLQKTDAPKKTDANLTKRIERFQDQLKKWTYL